MVDLEVQINEIKMLTTNEKVKKYGMRKLKEVNDSELNIYFSSKPVPDILKDFIKTTESTFKDLYCPTLISFDISGNIDRIENPKIIEFVITYKGPYKYVMGDGNYTFECLVCRVLQKIEKLGLDETAYNYACDLLHQILDYEHHKEELGY